MYQCHLSFSHNSCNSYLLSSCVLGAGDTVVNKIDKKKVLVLLR